MWQNILLPRLLGPLQAVCLHLAAQEVNDSTGLYLILKTLTTQLPGRHSGLPHGHHAAFLENWKGQESGYLGKTSMFNWGDKSWGKTAHSAKFLGVSLPLSAVKHKLHFSANLPSTPLCTKHGR